MAWLSGCWGLWPEPQKRFLLVFVLCRSYDKLEWRRKPVVLWCDSPEWSWGSHVKTDEWRRPCCCFSSVGTLNLIAGKASWAEELTFVVIQCTELGLVYWCRGEAHLAMCKVQPAGGAWSSRVGLEMKLCSCQGKCLCNTDKFVNERWGSLVWSQMYGEGAPQSLPQFSSKALLITLVSSVCIFLRFLRTLRSWDTKWKG